MDQKLFDTPLLQYVNVRDNFLKKFRNSHIWGKLGSKKRVIALDGFIKYYRETMDLVAKYPDELDIQVIIDNKNLVYNKTVLPQMPWKLRQEFVLAAPDSSGEEQLDQMFAKVEEEKAFSLMMFEMNELERVHNLKNYEMKKKHVMSKFMKEGKKEDAFQLRNLRKKMYKNIDLQQNVDIDIGEYQFSADEYWLKYHKDFTKKEKEAFDDKLKRTDDDVKKYKAEKDHVGSQVRMSVTEDKVKSTRTATSFDGINLQEDNTKIVENSANGTELIPSVHKMLEKARAEELLVGNLPDVPTHFTDDTFDNNLKSVDEELELRLLKLKLFRKNTVQDVTDSDSDVAPHETVSNATLKFSSETKRTVDSNPASKDVKPVAVIDDGEAREAFNAWYYQKIDGLQKKKNDSTVKTDADSFASERRLYDQVIPSSDID